MSLLMGAIFTHCLCSVSNFLGEILAKIMLIIPFHVNLLTNNIWESMDFIAVVMCPLVIYRCSTTGGYHWISVIFYGGINQKSM